MIISNIVAPQLAIKIVNKNPDLLYSSTFCLILAWTVAYGDLGEACGAKLASLAFVGASPPLWPPKFIFVQRFNYIIQSERSELSAAGLAPAVSVRVSVFVENGIFVQKKFALKQCA